MTPLGKAIRWAMDGYCIMSKEDRQEIAERIERELVKRKLVKSEYGCRGFVLRALARSVNTKSW